MRLSTFRAPSMNAAMAQLRAALGDEAVLLQTRQGRDGVEITAAVHGEDDEPWMVEPEARPVAPLLAPLPGGPLILVGTPGAGKTLTCVKLATRHVLAGREPLVVTTDVERAGAVEQLAAFARVLGIVFAVATTRRALEKALSRAAHGQPVLVDTAGCNPFQPGGLAALIEGLGQAVLVQPAGLCPEEARDEARAFHAMGVRHLLPTRLDVARRIGGTLAAARVGLALTEGSSGPDPVRGLDPITAEWLEGRS